MSTNVLVSTCVREKKKLSFFASQNIFAIHGNNDFQLLNKIKMFYIKIGGGNNNELKEHLNLDTIHKSHHNVKQRNKYKRMDYLENHTKSA